MSSRAVPSIERNEPAMTRSPLGSSAIEVTEPSDKSGKSGGDNGGGLEADAEAAAAASRTACHRNDGGESLRHSRPTRASARSHAPLIPYHPNFLCRASAAGALRRTPARASIDGQMRRQLRLTGLQDSCARFDALTTPIMRDPPAPKTKSLHAARNRWHRVRHFMAIAGTRLYRPRGDV